MCGTTLKRHLRPLIVVRPLLCLSRTLAVQLLKHCGAILMVSFASLIDAYSLVHDSQAARERNQVPIAQAHYSRRQFLRRWGSKGRLKSLPGLVRFGVGCTVARTALLEVRPSTYSAACVKAPYKMDRGAILRAGSAEVYLCIADTPPVIATR